MELNNHQLRAGLEAHLQRTGGQLDAAPDGPLLPCFAALELAQALEHEINRAQESGLPKISIKADIKDAAELAAYLRRAVYMGV